MGAGPAGLAAAFQLAREGHRVTVVDRRSRAGGTLRDAPETELPAAVLDLEIEVLARMGIDFKPGIELGRQVTLEGLTRGFDAILLTVGELPVARLRNWGYQWRGPRWSPIPTPARPPGPTCLRQARPSSLSNNWSAPWPRAGPPPNACAAF